MLGNILPPYHSLQELNLDWILTKVKDMLRFLPDDGSVGQILRRTAHGAEWSNEQGGGGGAVNSVNGQTGDVVLTAADVGALADTTPIPDSTSDLINDSGFVDAAGAAAAAPVQSVNGQTGAVTITAPVTSVNGQTGAVSLTIPTDTADLTNTAGFVDAAGAAAAAPVQSVNGQTGAVVLTGITVVDTGTMNDDKNMAWEYVKYSTGRYELFCVNGASSALQYAGSDESIAGIHRRFEERVFTGKKILYCVAQGQNSGRWIAGCFVKSGTTNTVQFLQVGVQTTVQQTSISAYIIAEDE